MKILKFVADPADIIEARQVTRITEEDPPEVTLLEPMDETNWDRYYFQSSQEIINFYRGETQ